MTSHSGAEGPPRLRVLATTLLLLSAAVLLSYRSLSYSFRYGTETLWFEDDFYYYWLIARHIADQGVSTFDSGVLTNGYHPLWLILLSGVARFVGDNLYVVGALELVLLLASFYFVRSINGNQPPQLLIIELYAFFWAIRISCLNGMEGALTLFCWTALVRTLLGAQPGARSRTWLLSALAIATIGARLDAAAYVVPLILLATPGAQRLRILLSLALFGAAYLVLNKLVFGTALPISGSVKALGGLQLNRALIAQLYKTHSLGSIARGTPITLALLTPVVWVALRRLPHDALPRRLGLAFLAGTSIYAAKLLFFSSWEVWGWYLYPIYMALVTLSCIGHDRLEDLTRDRRSRIVVGAIATGCLIHLGVFLVAAKTPEGKLFALANRAAVTAFSPILRGSRIAMGDRAGTFAYAYPGPVTQLEGLVNDLEYLRAIESHGDVKAVLCARGVEFLVNFGKPLRGAQSYQLETIRRDLASFDAPKLSVRADDLAQVFDGASVGYTEPDNQIYLWRFRCGDDANVVR